MTRVLKLNMDVAVPTEGDAVRMAEDVKDVEKDCMT